MKFRIFVVEKIEKCFFQKDDFKDLKTFEIQIDKPFVFEQTIAKRIKEKLKELLEQYIAIDIKGIKPIYLDDGETCRSIELEQLVECDAELVFSEINSIYVYMKKI